MVLMPGLNPGSVGERLAVALDRIGCSTVVYGLVQHPEKVIDQIVEEKIDCLIGLPAQVLSLARHPHGKLLGGTFGVGSISRVKDGPVNGIRGVEAIGRVDHESVNNIRGGIRPGQIKSVLLSADYVPKSIIDAIEAAWHRPVFTHWGMTETGLGGGVQCQAREGYHLRDADFWIEIVDPKGGEPVPDGQWGEIVLTTLTRTGMPLIRYRTGDISRFMTKPCPCGSHLKRLDRVEGRSVYEFSCGRRFRLDALDEALFRLPDIIDFEVRVQPSQPCHALNLENKGPAQQADNQVHTQADTQAKEKQDAPHLLEVQFWTAQGATFSTIEGLKSEIEQVIYNIPTIRQLQRQGRIEIKNVVASEAPLFSRGIKRKILVITQR